METTQAGKQFIPETGRNEECDDENSISNRTKQNQTKTEKVDGKSGSGWVTHASAELKMQKKKKGGDVSLSPPVSLRI